MMADHEGAHLGADRETRRHSFDTVAEAYDRFRPGYPEALIEDIITLSGLPPQGQILEVGSGTGKATEPFARRGYHVLCVEPGGNLVAYTAHKLARYPLVRFENAGFEEWQDRGERFDLLISASAWHWVSKEAGFARAAQVLRPGGSLALFWHMQLPPAGEMDGELQEVYRRCAPGLADDLPRDGSWLEATIAARVGEITASGLFGPVAVRRFPWSARYDVEHYLGLLNTYSDHLTMPPGENASLCAGVAEVMARHGGYLEKPVVSTLFMARPVAAG